MGWLLMCGVPLSVKACNISPSPSPPLPHCLVYYRDQRHLPRGVPMGVEEGGALKVCGGLRGGSSDSSVIASWLSLDLHVGVAVFLWVCFVLLGHLSVGLLSGDCFCEIITCRYCFFCMYYFNFLHVFYVMRNSPNCDIFYCIIISKVICLIL